MAQDAAEIVVASDGHISVAPYGTTLPTDPVADLDTDFNELGYVTADGCTFTATPSVTDITSWQSATPTRRLVTARALTVAFQLQQFNPESFSLAFGGGEWTSVGAGAYRFDPPADTDPLADWSLVIDAVDGDRNFRWVVNRGNVSDAVASNLVRTGAAVLPVTFSALAPEGADRSWYFLSDAAEFAAAS